MKFLIMFDNSNLLFFPGQFLTGRVILEVDDDMPVLGKFILEYFCKYLCLIFSTNQVHKYTSFFASYAMPISNAQLKTSSHTLSMNISMSNDSSIKLRSNYYFTHTSFSISLLSLYGSVLAENRYRDPFFYCCCAIMRRSLCKTVC